MALRTKKKKKQSKKSRNSKIKTDRSILEEIIRVDHAGEYGATRIYDGQIAVFGKNSKIGKTIQHMADQEQEHIETFEKLIINHRVRPTALLPLWNIAGFALGASTAIMGEKAAMACTVAVERVIGEHYKKQSKLLKDDQKKLRSTIKKFETTGQISFRQLLLLWQSLDDLSRLYALTQDFGQRANQRQPQTIEEVLKDGF